MPYIVSNKVCSSCGESNKSFRYRWHGQNQNYLFVSKCAECEKAYTKKHQQEHREYWRTLNQKSYQNWTPEQKAKRNKDSLMRHKRTKKASRGGENFRAWIFT